MTAKDYLDPRGYWGDPSGNIRRMSSEITARAIEEWRVLYPSPMIAV
jgi:hypothetical protein